MFRLCGASDTLIMTSLVDNVVNGYLMDGKQYFREKKLSVWEWCILLGFSDVNSQICSVKTKLQGVPSFLETIFS